MSRWCHTLPQNLPRPSKSTTFAIIDVWHGCYIILVMWNNWELTLRDSSHWVSTDSLPLETIAIACRTDMRDNGEDWRTFVNDTKPIQRRNRDVCEGGCRRWPYHIKWWPTLIYSNADLNPKENSHLCSTWIRIIPYAAQITSSMRPPLNRCSPAQGCPKAERYH